MEGNKNGGLENRKNHGRTWSLCMFQILVDIIITVFIVQAVLEVPIYLSFLLLSIPAFPVS